MAAAETTFKNTDFSMTAVIRQYRKDLFTVTQYDDAFGYNCGTKRFETKLGALAYCMETGFTKKAGV